MTAPEQSEQPEPRSAPPSTLALDAIGTHWRIDTPEPLDPETVRAIHRTIDSYDRVFSRFRPDSTVMAAARGAGTFEMPPEAGALFALYRQLGELTAGAINPLVGTSLEHLGYDAGYGLHPLPGYLAAPAWDDVCQWDGERLVTSAPVVLDVGAAGKGQLVDLVAAVLVAAGASEVTVNAGGDLVHLGASLLRVGLEDPSDTSGRRVIGVVEIRDAAVCGSSPNRRTWGPQLHHVLDARTGIPTTGVAATWATAPSAMVADGAASALFFVAPEALRAALGPEVHGIMVADDGRATWSARWPGETFTAGA